MQHLIICYTSYYIEYLQDFIVNQGDIFLSLDFDDIFLDFNFQHRFLPVCICHCLEIEKH